MAKVPLAGNVKTRLLPVLSPDDCAAFAGNLLADAVEKAADQQNKLIISYAPEGRTGYFDDLSERHDLILIPQKGTDLGEKMFNAFDFAFSLRLDSAVMIGTDSPTFPAAYFGRSHAFLENGADAVLGKTLDGGFYLIGLRVLKRGIFEKVDWSSAETFDQTATNIKNLGLKLALIPEWFDVDRPADLERLKKDLTEDPELAPQTARWLKQKFKSRNRCIE